MGSRLLPASLAACALLADLAGLQGLSFYLVLAGVPCAAGPAFLEAAAATEGRGLARGVTSCLALALLVLAAAVRAHAPVGAAVPALATSALVAVTVVYALPLLGWLFEPLKPRPRTRPARVRTSP